LSAAVTSPGVDQARARRLGAHWKFVNEQLHHHHEVEDASLWPLVRPKLAGREDDLAVVDQMEAQHLVLLPLGAAVSDGFDALAQEPGGEHGRDLAGRIDEVGTQLGSHLEDEELRCFPVVDQALTAEEFESFGKATAKAIGMRGAARFFPWIFDGADPVECKAVLSMPPPPVRILCRSLWEPRYERTVAKLWA